MKNLFKTIQCHYRWLKRRMKLIKYAFKDHNYDEFYIYKLLYIKFDNMVDYFEKDGVADMVPYIDKIKYCRNICKHLINCSSYPEHINTNNAKRIMGRCYDGWLRLKEAKPFKEWKIDILNDYDFKHDIASQDLYDAKAKNLLFELMKEYIETWWD